MPAIMPFVRWSSTAVSACSVDIAAFVSGVRVGVGVSDRSRGLSSTVVGSTGVACGSPTTI